MNALLLHGTGGSDTDYFWFADTKKYLEEKGYTVWWPLLPHTKKPSLKETLPFVLDNMPKLDDDSIVVGHSSACPLILSLLEQTDAKIKQAVLVAGFYRSLNDDGYSDLMLQEAYDWAAIKDKAEEFLLINSDNDPWGCDDQQARPVAIELGGTLVVATSQGHMGSSSFKQPYLEFPLLKRVLKV